MRFEQMDEIINNILQLRVELAKIDLKIDTGIRELIKEIEEIKKQTEGISVQG